MDERGVPTPRDWEQFELLTGLYKFYLQLQVGASSAYFAIAGGVLTLVLANVSDHDVVVIALLVPIVMSVLLALFARKTSGMVEELRVGMDELGTRLEVEVIPHVGVLEDSVRWAGRLLWLAAAFMAVLFVWLLVGA